MKNTLIRRRQSEQKEGKKERKGHDTIEKDYLNKIKMKLTIESSRWRRRKHIAFLSGGGNVIIT